VSMDRRIVSCCALALLAFFVLQVPSRAQSAAATRTTPGSFHYDVTKEVTLHATVSRVLKTASQGMVWGSHLMLATSAGTVDASLGRSAFHGVNPLSVTAGEHVEVTGVMNTIKGKQVFLVRTVKVNNHIYTLRNEHGALLASHDRLPSPERISAKGGK
jgi:DNA/RNA endonuclease YhcR with UshA esterase domain